MAALAKALQVQVPELIAEYFSKCRLVEERRALESRAVVTIQAYARGFIVRRRLQRLTRTVTTIQRHWRGYLGRLRGRLALAAYNRALRRAYFDAMATVVQRWWRGFYSRKYIHDYYARKRYLQAVRERNNQARAELNLEAERAIIMQRQEAEERARRLFADKVAKLHHLVSTATQPGIFNSPYSIATGSLPVIMGLPLEDHLKGSMRAQLRPAAVQRQKAAAATDPARAGGAVAGGSGRLPPLRSTGRSESVGRGGSAGGGSRGVAAAAAAAAMYPPTAEVAGRTVPARHTLRQAADFEAVHRAALLEEKIHRGEMLSQHPQAFTTALGAPKSPLFDLQSNRNLIPYNDPYDPVVNQRGPRFTPDQQRVSKTAFLRYIKRQPFYDENIAAEAY
ncbi:Spermatogenesis-associated protein 17 [Tetrabaena socialis]|uniref:Spermatogenesis-associated protein 17 n=1 Tax=Tetrabaena socialis TaxID=47790 RepID=A0A2J8A578_9CHLO|nr:Spermatogenesis-associated protein 17 [Tetrabaena socialis]|eukprot:PNH07657.1 Spermatogenesis-associated protein 17 [Tetrabaena socialis]